MALASIIAVAHVDAPIRVESEVIEQGFANSLARIGQRPGLVRALTGVVARRFWEEHVQPSDAATMAAQKVLAQCGIAPSSIGVLINTSVAKDFIEPSIASTVHGHLGLDPLCLNFDISNACLAFLDAIELAAMMIAQGRVRYALIVDGESSRLPVETTIQILAQTQMSEVELRNHFATLTLGSGAAAMVLGPVGESEHIVEGRVSVAATQHNGLCRGQRDHMITDAPALLQAGVDVAQQAWARAEIELGWRRDNIDHLIMHQVGSAHSRSVVTRLGLSIDRAFLTYPEFGNMGPASIPITLSKAVEAGGVYPGHRLALMGIGSGLNCSMMGVRW